MKPIVNAVILAGGFSRRMGTDKTGLPHPESGNPLLLHQLELITELAVERTFVSARSGQVLPALPSDVTRIDDTGDHGPLGGIAATFNHAQDDHLLVIPVDLPFLTADVLTRLIADTAYPESGVVAKSPRGLEPLIAVFPPSARAEIEDAIQQGCLSVKALIQGSLRSIMKPVDFTDPDLFRNWNSPSDI